MASKAETVATEGIGQVRLIHFSVLAICATVAYLMLRATSVPVAIVAEAERLSAGADATNIAAQIELLSPHTHRDLSDEIRQALSRASNCPVTWDEYTLENSESQDRRELLELAEAAPMRPSLGSGLRLGAARDIISTATWEIRMPTGFEILDGGQLCGSIESVETTSFATPTERGTATVRIEQVISDSQADDVRVFDVRVNFASSPRLVPVAPLGFSSSFPSLARTMDRFEDIPTGTLPLEASRIHRSLLVDEVPEVAGVRIRAEDIAYVAPTVLWALMLYMAFHLNRIRSYCGGPAFEAHESMWIGCTGAAGIPRVLAWLSVVVVPSLAAAAPSLVVEHFPVVGSGTVVFVTFVLGRHVWNAAQALVYSESSAARRNMEANNSGIHARAIMYKHLRARADELGRDLDRDPMHPYTDPRSVEARLRLFIDEVRENFPRG